MLRTLLVQASHRLLLDIADVDKSLGALLEVGLLLEISSTSSHFNLIIEFELVFQ